MANFILKMLKKKYESSGKSSKKMKTELLEIGKI